MNLAYTELLTGKAEADNAAERTCQNLSSPFCIEGLDAPICSRSKGSLDWRTASPQENWHERCGLYGR